MNLLQQLFAIPYAHLWIPGAIFVMVGGGLYWFLRPSALFAGSSPDGADAESVDVGTIQLATATMTQMSEAKKEKRNSVRRRGSPIAVRFAEPELKQEPEHGSVLDRSLGGLRVAVQREFDVGAMLSIRPVNAPDMVPWVNVEVRSCRPSIEMTGEFDLGCQFVTPPPYPILMLFG